METNHPKTIDLTPKEKPKIDRAELAKKIKYQRDKEKEKVRGIFRYHEVPGGNVEFVYGPVYKGDQTEKYNLFDGQIYTLPLGVAKHLNKNCWYPIHSFMMDENNRPTAKIGQRVRRMSFQSLEFVDIEDLAPNGNLVSVELSGVI